MNYGWIITSDLLGGAKHISETDGSGVATSGTYEDFSPTNGQAVGMVGPRDLADDLRTRLRMGDGQPFQMFDDDGYLYYEGRAIDCDGMEPLDDFGMANAGCTSIRWFEVPRKDDIGPKAEWLIA